ncbi:MAG: hypothetical protein QGD90_11220 [Candidatus Hydrogenedentes bacterium]|nr:hypothetical protein [Candidatus Hydrogenedentota bacterium]
MKRLLLLPALLLSCTLGAAAQDWSDSEVVRRRAEPVVTYRAKLDGDFLLLEAAHAKGWHTYALDNVERARKRSGREHPETELPTRIEVAGGLKIIGNWFQSKPEDLSQEVIRWYTWGFSRRAIFAVRVERLEGEKALVTINAQACDATTCQMVRDVVLTLPLATVESFSQNEERSAINFDELIEVARVTDEGNTD